MTSHTFWLSADPIWQKFSKRVQRHENHELECLTADRDGRNAPWEGRVCVQVNNVLYAIFTRTRRWFVYSVVSFYLYRLSLVGLTGETRCVLAQLRLGIDGLWRCSTVLCLFHSQCTLYISDHTCYNTDPRDSSAVSRLVYCGILMRS